MSNSSYIWREEFEAVAAEGHNRSGTPVRTRLWGFNPSNARMPAGVDIPMFAVPNAAASLYTTVTDYGRFLEGVLKAPAADRSHLSHASLDAMFSPAVRVNGQLSWGLGWGLARAGGTETFWQWGNNGPYQSFLVGSRDEGWGAVMLTNSANGLKGCRDIVARLVGEDHPAFQWSNVLPPAAL
jgi:hypothetical protein